MPADGAAVGVYRAGFAKSLKRSGVALCPAPLMGSSLPRYFLFSRVSRISYIRCFSSTLHSVVTSLRVSFFKLDETAQTAPRRNRNACDACRARKVKCVYDGPACRSCVALQIACTRNRPRKKRGPLNRYVEAERQAETATPSLSPASPSTYVLDQLGPPQVIDQIIHDWFELVHSVAPILHRASFLRRLAAGDATYDREFANLIISICAATTASLRRKSSTYGDIITVERCVELAERHGPTRRQSGFTLEWCQTKYNFAVALFSKRGLDNPDSSLLIAEALAGVKYLIHYQLDQMSFMAQQLLKRTYWLIFAGQCTMGIHGRPYLGMFSPHENMEALKPLEVNDEELEPSIGPQLDDWHGDRMTYIPGLNHLTNLFMLWYRSQQEAPHSLERLQEYMRLVETALDYLPPELRWRGGLSRPPQSNFGTDVQTVNLYITQIHIRSFLLDQMDRLAVKQGAAVPSVQITAERQRIIDDMLAIVYQMPEDTLEANGHSLIPKLRDIGLGLLREDVDPTHALVNLDKLLRKLERLDFPPGAQFEHSSPASV